ncbi:hypothetical protein ACFQ1R_11560, partial [Mariniflexile jejuense]
TLANIKNLPKIDNMRKLILPLILLYTVLFSCESETANPADNEEVPIESDCKEIIPSIWVKGDGSISNPYQIESAEHLFYLAQQVNDTLSVSINDYTSKYFKLVSDINLSCKSWTPIGGLKTDYIFNGHFDGNNKSISNIVIDYPEKNYVGFFGIIGYNSSIKNLLLEGDVNGYDFVGGIVGTSLSKSITNSSFTGNVIGNDNVGGLLGYETSNGVKIENCSFNGIIKGNEKVGGVVGRSVRNTLENCSANLTSLNGNFEVGGITGYSSGDMIKNCFSLGDIGGENMVGGVTGWAEFSTNFEDSNFNGSLSGKTKIGGIVGYLSGDSKISKCYNKGIIETSGVEVGGIVGSLYNGTVELSYNIGNISGIARCGGIVGRCDALNNKISYIENCYNIGSINCNSLAAGIVGGAGIADIKYCYNIGLVPNTSRRISDNDNIVVYDYDGFSTTVNVTACYFLEGDYQFSTDGISKSISEMKSSTFINQLNGAANILWKSDISPNINSGFPILNWQ